MAPKAREKRQSRKRAKTQGKVEQQEAFCASFTNFEYDDEVGDKMIEALVEGKIESLRIIVADVPLHLSVSKSEQIVAVSLV